MDDNLPDDNQSLNPSSPQPPKKGGPRRIVRYRPTSYPSNLTDDQWRQISPLLPQEMGIGRNRATNFREIVNALLYLAKTRASYRKLPTDFPPWGTVHSYVWNWQKQGILPQLAQELKNPDLEWYVANRFKPKKGIDRPTTVLGDGEKQQMSMAVEPSAASVQILGRTCQLTPEAQGLCERVNKGVED